MKMKNDFAFGGEALDAASRDLRTKVRAKKPSKRKKDNKEYQQNEKKDKRQYQQNEKKEKE